MGLEILGIWSRTHEPSRNKRKLRSRTGTLPVQVRLSLVHGKPWLILTSDRDSPIRGLSNDTKHSGFIPSASASQPQIKGVKSRALWDLTWGTATIYPRFQAKKIKPRPYPLLRNSSVSSPTAQQFLPSYGACSVVTKEPWMQSFPDPFRSCTCSVHQF